MVYLEYHPNSLALNLLISGASNYAHLITLHNRYFINVVGFINKWNVHYLVHVILLKRVRPRFWLTLTSYCYSISRAHVCITPKYLCVTPDNEGGTLSDYTDDIYLLHYIRYLFNNAPINYEYILQYRSFALLNWF